MSSKKNIFAIYASQDKDVLQYLLLHLQPLEKDFDIAIWSDDAINPGQPWKPRNVSRLDHADIFLLLLSNTFMHSEFIKQDEFKMVIDRYKEGKATVIPILLDDCPWDVEFTSDDYNFNFRELQVFPRDEKPIGDWNSTDEVFKEIAYHVRGSLTSSTKKSALEEPSNKGENEKKILNTKKEEQIAIDFFEEREANNKAERERKRKIEAEAKKRVEENNILREEAEAKKRVEENNKLSEEAEAKEVIRKEKRLRQKAEIQKRIEKEKSLKEKSKKDKKIEDEAEAKSIVQEDMRGNEEVKVQMAVEEKRRGELEKVEREAERENRLGEVVVAQKRVTKNNRLARYNYQFKTAKVVEAKRVVQEQRRGNEEAKAPMVVEEKRHVEITKPERREPELEKKLREVVAVKESVMTKNGLAAYNYQFKTAKVVAAKRVVQEQRRGDEDVKVQMGEEVKRRFEIIKSKIETELKKRLTEVVTALKRIMKKYGFPGTNYQLKNATAVNQTPKDAPNKKNTYNIRRVHPSFLIAALVICVLFIYVLTGDSGKQSTTISETEKVEVASDTDAETKTNSENMAAATLILGVGDTFEDGIIFKIDPSNKKGKIAYSKDIGPMPWKNAMNIHEQLGEGWRLPTLDELQLMYQTIGQGATNSGQFADELYWSATPYDEYQARVLRFRDGNSSYHYNSTGSHRKFQVRAVREINQ